MHWIVDSTKFTADDASASVLFMRCTIWIEAVHPEEVIRPNVRLCAGPQG